MTHFTEAGGWTTATNQLFPLGATDYSAYALNIANSGADTLVVIGFGNDAVNSIKQAKQFGLLDKMTLVVPYMSPYLVQQVGQDLMAGVYAGLDFYWDIGDKFPLAKQFVDKFEAKYGAKPVESKGDFAMGGRPIFKCAKQKSEFMIRFFAGHAQRVEHLFLEFPLIYTD